MHESDTETLKNFGAIVREQRIAAGYSQESFAFHSGIDRTYLSSLERGHRNVSLKNIKRIADALNLKMSTLMEDL